jgi:hypothetical protein
VDESNTQPVVDAVKYPPATLDRPALYLREGSDDKCVFTTDLQQAARYNWQMAVKRAQFYTTAASQSSFYLPAQVTPVRWENRPVWELDECDCEREGA